MRIFLIEDNKVDMLITQKVIRRTLPQPIIDPFPDGLSALEALQVAASENQSCFPQLIFLDMCLPLMDGRL